MYSKYEGKMLSLSQEHETPDDLFETLHKEFNFQTDLAASELNHKLSHYYTKDNDALSYNWHGRNWLNQPFNKVGKWVEKAYKDSKKYKSTIVMLVLVKANTNWWRDYIFKAKEVRFINQKIQFKNTEQGLRFPACIVVFQPHRGSTKWRVIKNKSVETRNDLKW